MLEAELKIGSKTGGGQPSSVFILPRYILDLSLESASR